MQKDPLVNVVPFKFKHLPLLLEMLKSRDYLHISQVNMKTLPKIGYIALIKNQPIAAGFLRKVEGGYAQIDGLTSSPYFGSNLRNEGISKIVDMLISDAKDLKVHGIISFTEDEGVLKRAKVLGFQVVNQVIITLPL